MSTAAELARSGPLALPRICCLDLDTFFVSVERVLDPSLEGKPVVVGGQPGSRGVVTAASYEVRRLGVKSGMSLVEAGKLAPDAVYLPTRGDTYGKYAERVREIARRYAATVVIAIREMSSTYRDASVSTDEVVTTTRTSPSSARCWSSPARSTTSSACHRAPVSPPAR